DFERDRVAFERGDVCLEAQGGLGGVHLQFVDQVVVVTSEEGVRLDGDVNVEVAWAAAVVADVTFAIQAHARPVANAGRYLDREVAALAEVARSTAFPARVGNHTAFAATLVAGSN